MKPKTMILMAVAIVCGLGASYMTSRLLAERDDQPKVEAPPEPEYVKFLVAKANLDHGAAIKNPHEMFIEKKFLKEDAPKDGVNEVKILKGKFLKRPLRRGDLITSEDLVDEKTSILANLPDGFQAYGIQVDPASIAGGWAATPGSKVNILWTMRAGDNKNSFCKILLEDVLVLAADANGFRPEEGKAMLASVVIVALKTSDTMKVKLAQMYGPLSLTLRKYGDTAPTPNTETFTGENLLTAKLERKDSKRTGPDLSTDNPEDGGDLVNNAKVPPVELKPEPKPEVKKEEAPPPPKRYYHYVNFRQGDKQWREKIEVDVNGLPVQDDVQHDEQEQPAVQAQPAPRQQSADPKRILKNK